jgi:hypothetical protein
VQDVALRQIVYQSRAVGRPDIGAILVTSKTNNGMDGISGLLLFDGRDFVQALEGPENSVAAAFDRICSDPRHKDVRVASDRLVEVREFPYWSMDLREPSDISDNAIWRLRRRLDGLSPDLRHYFLQGAQPEEPEQPAT